jgi:hypothetical protein
MLPKKLKMKTVLKAKIWLVVFLPFWGVVEYFVTKKPA